MQLLVILLVGFSVVAAIVLYVAYVFFLNNLSKSPRALGTCALLLMGLAQLQLGHYEFMLAEADPLQSWNYRVWLFLVPSMFYLFSRSILFEESRFSPSMAWHLLPVLLPFVVRIEIAVSILFCVGAGYSLWLTHIVYQLAGSRSRSRFELFFLVLFSAMALVVLLLGFALPYIDVAFFYYSYAIAIGVALALVVGALLSFPQLLAEIAEAAKISYATSTLVGLNVENKKAELVRLMEVEQVFQQEDLSLAGLADLLELSAHQLSELINTQFNMSFSRYVREHRIHRAIHLLQSQPHASVLSISIEVGFRSQSNFYAAFKEITGHSPSSYRK